MGLLKVRRIKPPSGNEGVEKVEEVKVEETQESAPQLPPITYLILAALTGCVYQGMPVKGPSVVFKDNGFDSLVPELKKLASASTDEEKDYIMEKILQTLASAMS